MNDARFCNLYGTGDGSSWCGILYEIALRTSGLLVSVSFVLFLFLVGGGGIRDQIGAVRAERGLFGRERERERSTGSRIG